MQWEIEADEFVSCNCAYGCPCQFNALPTRGTCESVGAYQIRKGYFGDISLDGLRIAGILVWPGPIHEGRGQCLWIVDASASQEQREALLTIVNGGETDPGATMWNVFASTMETVLDPVFEPISLEIDVDARTGRLVVAGLIECTGTPIRNPVTGEEHRARIDLPNGFGFRLAEMGSSTFTTQGAIRLSYQDCYGQFARIHLSNRGVVEAR